MKRILAIALLVAGGTAVWADGDEEGEGQKVEQAIPSAAGVEDLAPDDPGDEQGPEDQSSPAQMGRTVDDQGREYRNAEGSNVPVGLDEGLPQEEQAHLHHRQGATDRVGHAFQQGEVEKEQ